MSPQVFKKSDLLEALWSLAPAGGLLRLRQNDKVTINFHGFAKGEEGRLKDALQSKLDMDLVSQPMHLSGHNWGNLRVHGGSVAFQVRPPHSVWPFCDDPALQHDRVHLHGYSIVAQRNNT